MIRRLARRLRGPSWTVLLISCVVAVVAGEAVLLDLGTGYFGHGYNSQHVAGPAGVAIYLFASAILDAAFVLGLWGLCSGVIRALRMRKLQSYWALAFVGVGVPLAMAVAIYNVHVTLGRLVSFSLLRAVSGDTSGSNLASVTAGEVAPYGLVAVAVVLAAALVLLRLARHLEARYPALVPMHRQPSARPLVLASLVAWPIGAAILVFSQSHAPWLYYGLSRKASGTLVEDVVRWVSDVDRDGAGLLSRPPDPAPFEAAIHPYALEVPGNGVDENGMGGDLPAGFAPEPPVGLAHGPARARPHFLLIYLESFRADLLDRSVAGREVAPFLSRLAREGARSEHAWVHSPWTLPSRAQMFAGRVVARPGDRTLVDDFHERGYRVAIFSGQDDTFGDSVALMGADRADHFYHARHDLDLRTSRSTAPVSVQVSWKTLLDRALPFLSEADPDVPLFLYVNVVDTHFPYFHDEMDPILDVDPIDRGDIRADNAQAVFEAYANSAANVDLAVQRLVEAWSERMAGRPQAILVTGDHGQSFYEAGTLGHGQELGRAQAQVPFILWQIGGEWPEPIAPSDVRGLLDRNLFLPRNGLRPRFVPDPERRVFQYLGRFEHPERLGLRGIGGLLEYDVLRDRTRWVGAGGARPEPDRLAELEARLVHTWEFHARSR